MKKSLFLTLLFVPVLCFSQWGLDAQIKDFVNDYNVYRVIGGDHLNKYLPNPYAQYLFTEFKEGQLQLKSGENIVNGKYNYNILRDELQFIMKNDTLSFLEPNKIKDVSIDNTTLIFSWYQSKDDLFRGYFELLSDGKYQLLNKRFAEFIEAQPALALKEPVKAHYEFKSKYYILKQNEIAHIIWNKTELLKYFKSENIDVKPIMKEHKLRFYKRKDMIKLFELINKES